MTLTTLRKWSLAIAESIDAFRIVPRIILVAYGWMVWVITRWYIAIPTSNSMECQSDVMNVALQNGATFDQARAVACSVIGSVGGPTSEQTMFVSIIVGLSSVVIGLYLNTGHKSKWQGDVIQAIEPTPPMGMGQRNRYPDHGQGYGYGRGPFIPEGAYQPYPHSKPAGRGSWFDRIRGRKSAPVAGETQMPDAPDLGEDEYQG